jgi:hypothetical protein
MQDLVYELPRSRNLRTPASRARVPLPREQPLEAQLSYAIAHDGVET